MRKESQRGHSLGSGGSSLLSISSGLLNSLSGGLSLLDELGDELLVLGSSGGRALGLLNLRSLDDSLSSKAFLSDKSLDSWGLVVGLISLGDGSVVHISTDIVTLLKVEVSRDVGSSLLGKTVWLVVVGEASDLLLSLLDDAEGNDGEVWSTDATTD